MLLALCRRPARGLLRPSATALPAALPAAHRVASSARDELQTARAWLDQLHAEAIPLRSIGELTFSRSSGPGGQNVNKYGKVTKI